MRGSYNKRAGVLVAARKKIRSRYVASRRTRLVMGAGIRPASRYFLHISKSSMLKLVVLRPNHIRNYTQQKKALAWSQSLSRDTSGISKLRAATPSAATARPSSTLQGQTLQPSAPMRFASQTTQFSPQVRALEWDCSCDIRWSFPETDHAIAQVAAQHRPYQPSRVTQHNAAKHAMLFQ